MSKSKTILFVSHSSRLYGAGQSLFDLLDQCPPDINPLVLVPSSGKLTSKLDKNNIDYIITPYSWWISNPKHYPISGPYHSLKNIWGYLSFKKNETLKNIDLVYTNTIASPMGGMLSQYLDVQNVWHIREFVEEDHQLRFDFGKTITGKYISRSSEAVIYNSNAVKNKFSRYLSDVNEHVIYNGPISKDLLDSRNIRTEPIVEPISVLVVGSVQSGKNQMEAIEAVSKALSRGISIELIIVGDGDQSYIDECKKRSEELGVSTNISWEGYQESVERYYIESDITLVPSRSEAFGRVVVEAMSYGSPVVARASGALPEIISHGQTGLLYSTVNELIDNIGELYTHPTLLENISRNAMSQTRKNYSKESYTSNVYTVFRELDI